MATGLSSPLGVAGVLLIILGIIMAVVGVIFLIAMSTQSKPWWTWFLLIGGIIMGIIGGILLAIALSQSAVVVTPTAPIPAPQAPQYVVSPTHYTHAYHGQPTHYLVAAQPAPQIPTQHMGTRTYPVGGEHFDPDPHTVVTQSPPTPRRTTVVGPYGPGGQNIQISGTYTPPGTVTATTYDIGHHPVVSTPAHGQVVMSQPNSPSSFRPVMPTTAVVGAPQRQVVVTA